MTNFTPEIEIKKGRYLHYKIVAADKDLRFTINWGWKCISLYSNTEGYSVGCIPPIVFENEADAFGYVLIAQRMLHHIGLNLFKENLENQYHG
ncbi:MAG: hypothetical protein AAF757_23405 [Cyanobacteria bacterium P01_D01_bin.116]